MAATWGDSEQTDQDSGGQDIGSQAAGSSVLVVVVRSAQHNGVNIYRPNLTGWQAPHIVFLAERGLTDRDILYRSWHLLSSDERETVSESFGLGRVPDHQTEVGSSTLRPSESVEPSGPSRGPD